MQIFRTLMTSRIYGWTVDSVHALNLIDVVFAKDTAVRGAWIYHGGRSTMQKHHSTSENNGFFSRVYEIVARIPEGKVVSYGQIARMLGAPRAARQVGWAMRHCPDELPWQRVVRDDGTIAGGGYADLRRMLLSGEGIQFLSNGTIDMKHYRWNGK